MHYSNSDDSSWTKKVISRSESLARPHIFEKNLAYHVVKCTKIMIIMMNVILVFYHKKSSEMDCGINTWKHTYFTVFLYSGVFSLPSIIKSCYLFYNYKYSPLYVKPQF